MTNKFPYNTRRWLRLRLIKLQTNPLCETCEKLGRVVPATVVDHIHPISAGGSPYPPLDELQSQCAPCHNLKTRGEQLGRELIPKVVNGCDVHGGPLK
jgi:5-methylcytosine-specific restriction protein A